jgi:hypothetical protein
MFSISTSRSFTVRLWGAGGGGVGDGGGGRGNDRGAHRTAKCVGKQLEQERTAHIQQLWRSAPALPAAGDTPNCSSKSWVDVTRCQGLSY